jgi:hypothetical protein
LIISKQITIQDDSDSLERIEKEGQDPLLNTIYAKDVFNYLKEREVGIKVVESRQ